MADGRTDSPESRAERVALAVEDAARELLARAEAAGPDGDPFGLGAICGFDACERVRAARLALEPLRSEALLALFREERAARDRGSACARPPESCLVFGAGAIPEPAVRAIAGAAMVAARTRYRPSRRESALASELAVALAARGVAVRAETWDRERRDRTRELAGEADAIVVFGGDEVVRLIRSLARPDARVFAYGPRASFAAIDLATDPDPPDATFAALAEDVFAYDQRGCLSPSALYAIGGDDAALARTIDRVAGALARRAGECGERRISPADAMAVRAIRRARIMAAAPPSRAFVGSDAWPGFAIAIDREDPTLRPSPGYATLFFHPVATWDALAEAVAPESSDAPGLQAAAAAPDPAAIPAAVLARLRARGLSRTCAFGEMQRPPLNWRHDGNPFFPFAAG